VGGCNKCGGYTLLGFAMTRWLTGLWSTQAKVDGIVSMTAWLCGKDSSVSNDPLREPVRNPLYISFPSALVSLNGELIFFHILLNGSFFGENHKVNFQGNHAFCRKAPCFPLSHNFIFNIFRYILFTVLLATQHHFSCYLHTPNTCSLPI